MLPDSRQGMNKMLELTQGLEVLGQPVDRAICETGTACQDF